MRRNLVASLFEHETVSTTPEKAKEVKAFAERLITLARKGTLAARRRAIDMLGDRDIVSYEDGKAVKKGTIIGKLFSELAPRYLDRPGGYTRIIRLSLRRLGDNGQLVLLQLVGEEDSSKKQPRTGAGKSARRRARKAAHAKEAAEVEQAVGPEQAADETVEPEQAADEADDQQ
jgi:large subunit ribosomal protein L17